MTIEVREVRFPSQRKQWTELGGVWRVECNRCGSYDHNSKGLGTGTFLRGYPTEADAQAAGYAHECFPPAVELHERDMSEFDDCDYE